MSNTNYVKEITDHLREKNVYSDEYIERVGTYMRKEPDLAEEFALCIPKNVIHDEYISVHGITAKDLGLQVFLPKSSIYVILARLREANGDNVERIIAEEDACFKKHKIR